MAAVLLSLGAAASDQEGVAFNVKHSKCFSLAGFGFLLFLSLLDPDKCDVAACALGDAVHGGGRDTAIGQRINGLSYQPHGSVSC